MGYDESTEALLVALSDSMKQRVSAQFLAKRTSSEKAKHPDHDYATINERLLTEFEPKWASWQSRKQIVPGKELLAELNKHLQSRYHIAVTPLGIVNCMEVGDIPEEIRELIDNIDRFRSETIE